MGEKNRGILTDDLWPNASSSVKMKGGEPRKMLASASYGEKLSVGHEIEPIPAEGVPVFNEEEPENADEAILQGREKRDGMTDRQVVSQQDSVDHWVAPGEQVLARVERVSDPMPAIQIPARQTIVEIGNTVAQRILVHEASDAKSEIFIQLRENILPGTEIALFREGTSLRVDFFSRAGKSVMFLSQHIGALQEYLMQRLEFIKEVKVHVYDHSEYASGNSLGQERNRRHRQEHTSRER
jgi:hypothetical protein